LQHLRDVRGLWGLWDLQHLRNQFSTLQFDRQPLQAWVTQAIARLENLTEEEAAKYFTPYDPLPPLTTTQSSPPSPPAGTA
jgi:hypothetical protein